VLPCHGRGRGFDPLLDRHEKVSFVFKQKRLFLNEALLSEHEDAGANEVSSLLVLHYSLDQAIFSICSI
jgi:hypothetical protein